MKRLIVSICLALSVSRETLAQTATLTPTQTATQTPSLTQTITPTVTVALTPTLTRTPTPSASSTITFTRSPTSTRTRTPTPTSTHSPTALPTFTPVLTSTPGCSPILLTGTVYDSQGQPAAGQHVTIQIMSQQGIPSGCAARPSLMTITLTAQGIVPPNTYVLGGAIVLITLQGGIGREVVVPLEGPVDLSNLLGNPTPAVPAPDGAINKVVLNGSTEWNMGVTTPIGYGVLLLTPENVAGFTLTDPGDSGGHTITSLGVPTTTGDALSYGMSVGGDLTGTLPNPTLRFPPIASSTTFPATVLVANTCAVHIALVPGANVGMLPIISPRTPLPTPVTWQALIVLNGQVACEECAIGAGVSTASTVFDIRVLQASAYSPIATVTPTKTQTSTRTVTGTRTPTRTNTRTPTRTFTLTPTRTPTRTPTNTP